MIIRNSSIMFVVLIVTSLVVGSCDGDKKAPIVIAGVFPVDNNDSARLRLGAIELAVKEVNESGVFDREVKVINMSPAEGKTYNAELAAENAKELHQSEDAVGVISLYSGIAKTIIEATNSARFMRYVQCSCSASAPGLNDPTLEGGDMNDTFYRTVIDDNFQGMLMTKLITYEYSWQKVGILTSDETFGQGLRNVMKEMLPDGAVVVDEVVPDGDFDIGTVEEELQAFLEYPGGLDVIILATNLKDGLVPDAVEYFLDNNYSGNLLLSDGAKSDGLLSDEMSTLIGNWISAGHIIIGTEPYTSGGKNSEAFEDAYKAEYGEDPDTYSYTAYDCVYAFAYSLLYAGKDHYTAEGVKGYMPRFKEFNRKDSEIEVGIGVEEFKDGAKTIRLGRERVNFEGASGRLLFDGAGDRPEMPMQTFTLNAEINGWKQKDIYDVYFNKILDDSACPMNSGWPCICNRSDLEECDDGVSLCTSVSTYGKFCTQECDCADLHHLSTDCPDVDEFSAHSYCELEISGDGTCFCALGECTTDADCPPGQVCDNWGSHEMDLCRPD